MGSQVFSNPGTITYSIPGVDYTGGTIYWSETPTQQYTRDYLALVAAGIAMGLDENEIDEFVDSCSGAGQSGSPKYVYEHLVKIAYTIRSKRK